MKRRRYRRGVLAFAFALTLALPPTTGQAACAPGDRATIEWIVPFSAGGGYDTYSRLLEPYFERESGTEVVVVNAPGAGGLIGARKIQSADADGHTIGMISASGMLISRLTEADIPHPGRDFRILGQVSPSPHVWVVAADSPIRAVSDLITLADERPVLFSASGSTPLASAALGSHVLGLRLEPVTGYDGSRESSLALLRGEVDATSIPFDSSRDLIDQGEVRPILQITTAPMADRALAGVPALGGDDGAAVDRARQLGQAPDEASSFASAMVGMLALTRVVVAPHQIDPAVAQCLENALVAAASDPAFVADATSAGRFVQLVRRAEVEAQIDAASAYSETFGSILQAELAELRE